MGLRDVLITLAAPQQFENEFSIAFGLRDVSRMQSNIFLSKEHQKSPLKSVNCSKLYEFEDDAWNIPSFAVGLHLVAIKGNQ